MGYIIKATVAIRQQSDGSWLAESTAPPFMTVAPSRGELDHQVEDVIGRLVESLSLRRSAGQGMEDVLRELGASYEWEPAPAEEATTTTVPVPA